MNNFFNANANKEEDITIGGHGEGDEISKYFHVNIVLMNEGSKQKCSKLH